MKKILLATTMLAGTAGFAAAEGVNLSGYAEMGIYSNAAGDVQFWQEVDVTFSMSGTTDGGLEFGASVDLDETPIVDTTDDGGWTVYVSGAFGKLTMGDTDGGFDWAMQEVGALTAIADDHTTHVGYSGNSGLDGDGDGQVVRYENTFGGFGFAISAEQGDNGVGAVDDILGLGLKYTADLGGTALNLGLGYQEQGSNDVMGLSVGADLTSGIGAVLNYSTMSVGGVDTDHTAIGLTYTSGAMSAHINYGQFDTAGVKTDGFGVAVNYDLGGGAVVMAGYGSDVDGAGNDSWSVGLGMSF